MILVLRRKATGKKSFSKPQSNDDDADRHDDEKFRGSALAALERHRFFGSRRAEAHIRGHALARPQQRHR